MLLLILFSSLIIRYQSFISFDVVESSYNAPIIALFADIGCAARDLSGERKGQYGENIDIKLWHTEEEVTETEPFAGNRGSKGFCACQWSVFLEQVVVF